MQEFFEKDFYEKLAYNLCHFKYKKYCNNLLEVYFKAINSEKIKEIKSQPVIDFDYFQNTINNTIELTSVLTTEINVYNLLIEIAKKYSYIYPNSYMPIVEKLFFKLLLSKKIEIQPSNIKYFQWLFIQELLEACIPDLKKLNRETEKYIKTLQVIFKEKEKIKNEANDKSNRKAHNALSDFELTKWYKCNLIYQEALSSCKILKFLIKARLNKWNKEQVLFNWGSLSVSENENMIFNKIIEKMNNDSEYWYEELTSALSVNYKGLYRLLIEDFSINTEDKIINKFKNIKKSTFAIEVCRNRCSITKGLADKAILNNISSIDLKYYNKSFKYYTPKEQVKYEFDTWNYHEQLSVLLSTLHKCFRKFINNPEDNKFELESRIFNLKLFI